jgi:hypothetical protein
MTEISPKTCTRLAALLGAATILAAGVAVAKKEQPTSAPAEMRHSQPASQPASCGDRTEAPKVLAVLKDRLPMRYKRLMELKETDPNEYAFHLAEMIQWYEEWKHWPPAIQDADILQQSMTVRIWQIVKKMQKTTSEKSRDKLREDLKEAVTKQIDAEHQVNEYKLGVLEEELTRMREQLDEHNRNRDAVIEGTMDHLLQAASQPAEQHHPTKHDKAKED